MVCFNNCTIPRCGDGIVTADEAYDDGNDVDGDECTNTCQRAVCGDGIVYGTDPMTAMMWILTGVLQCETAVCGDGIIHDGVETCDAGTQDW